MPKRKRWAFKNIILLKKLVGSTKKLRKRTYWAHTHGTKRKDTVLSKLLSALMVQFFIEACINSTYLAGACVKLKHREEKDRPCPQRPGRSLRANMQGEVHESGRPTGHTWVVLSRLLERKGCRQEGCKVTSLRYPLFAWHSPQEVLGPSNVLLIFKCFIIAFSQF